MDIIDKRGIEGLLEAAGRAGADEVREILAAGRELKGISAQEALALLAIDDPELLAEMFATARSIKDSIYGRRLVLFAPLYISNLCENDCAYCAFRKTNAGVARRALSQEEIGQETEALLAQGQKRALLVAGESYTDEGLEYILQSIDTIYSTRTAAGSIRRINVNIAPLTADEFRELHSHDVGTYQLFQETYHEPTYRNLHPRGPKSDYDYRLATMDRAFEGGFDDVGIGVLFGLYDFRYEIAALLAHISHLERKFGVGPHTISVPRIEPALGSPLSCNPPRAVSDADFKKIVAVLRIAVPYTGIILSTRESAAMRREAFELGVSQISAGSRTNPGGYSGDGSSPPSHAEQFSLGDSRPVMEVIRDIVEKNHIPSFCTACYRLGRVGKDFMDLAKPGLIRHNCLPNALLTFAEYLHDFADDRLRAAGLEMIERMVQNDVEGADLQERVRSLLAETASGRRDIFV